jgi:hypothetical protein
VARHSKSGEGVQRANGKTFCWSSEYSWDLNTRQTRSMALNVFENFRPALPKVSAQVEMSRPAPQMVLNN